jgi:hypothetical protein
VTENHGVGGSIPPLGTIKINGLARPSHLIFSRDNVADNTRRFSVFSGSLKGGETAKKAGMGFTGVNLNRAERRNSQRALRAGESLFKTRVPHDPCDW